MDWLWPIFQEHVDREVIRHDLVPGDATAQDTYFRVLQQSKATLYVMEPVGDTIRFKGLGRWPLAEVPQLLYDPHAFIADRFGGGKYKVNFHHDLTFVGTHNFRTYGDEVWRTLPEQEFE